MSSAVAVDKRQSLASMAKATRTATFSREMHLSKKAAASAGTDGLRCPFEQKP
jgi:hypothetical protein